jgi:hypothetical protein
VVASPVVVSFEGNPANVPGKVWFGRPWQGNTDVSTSLPANANNYFSLAVFRPDDAGQYRRQKARFHALHSVMLDDVGTKVDMERLMLPPSWLLETSQGNHQAGYLLLDPITDGPTADRLMNASSARAVRPGREWPTGAASPAASGGERQALATVSVSINGMGARVTLFRRGTGRWPSVGGGSAGAAQAPEHAPHSGATW